MTEFEAVLFGLFGLTWAAFPVYLIANAVKRRRRARREEMLKHLREIL